MAVVISATLAGASDPQAVQVSITGLTAGVAFTVTASTGAWSWTVPGGNGQLASGTTVVLADILIPLATSATYYVTQSGTTSSSSPVSTSVLADGDVVVQSLDGLTTIAATWIDAGDPREQSPRVALFQIPGRAAPVARWDVSTTDSGTMLLEVEGSASATLRRLVAIGGPVILRTDGTIRDVDPVQIVMITKAPRELVGATGTLRQWAIGFQVIDYPDLSTVLAASTWTDFDTAWAALTGTDFDTYFAALTGDQLDVIDWTTF